MRKGILISAIVIILIIVGSLMFGLRDRSTGQERNEESIKIVAPAGQNEEEIEELPSGPATSENPGDSGSAQTHKITITSSGFSPSSLEINAGDSVIFENSDTNQHWPASAVHPTHRVYPGSDIGKCGTAEAENIFDACRGLESGESYTFIFNERGSWRYHDHLRASIGGTIIVN